MPRVDGKLSRTFSGNTSLPSLPNSGIVIYIYKDIDAEPPFFAFSCDGEVSHFTAEQLCENIAQKLGIGTLAFPLFALRCEGQSDRPIWRAPNDEIICPATSTVNFTFRVRFVPPELQIRQLSSTDKIAFRYLFLQIRDDFINGNITYREGKGMGQDHELGLGVIDMVRFGIERKLDLPSLLKQDPRYFIPACIREGVFRYPWHMYRLRKNFVPYLEKEHEKYSKSEDENVDLTIKWTYIDGVLKFADHYGAEHFMTVHDGIDVDVRPYCKINPGVLIHASPHSLHSSFEDLMDVSISNTGSFFRVQINRKTGVPHLLHFNTREEARSFVALLDGYYRLSVDYHHSLCSEVGSPIIQRLKQLKSHGPVSSEWALERLRRKQEVDSNFNYLLKLRQRKLGQYILLYLPWRHSEPKYHEIEQRFEQQSNCHMFYLNSDENREFVSISQLLEFYRKDGNSNLMCLHRCVVPVNPVSSKLYLCRLQVGMDQESESDIARVKPSTQNVCLIPVVKVGEKIGRGLLTDVYTTSFLKDNRTADAVIKQLRPEFFKLQQFFSDGINRALFWCHPTIVSFYAVCLATPMSFVMERAPLGSLADYLEQPAMDLKNYHLVVAAEQIAQALCYLEEKDQVHGNICCQNILLFTHEQMGSFTVKLSDPGMIHALNGFGANAEVNIKRLPWIAPECYDDLKTMTLESDRYAYGTTLYEMFSTGGPFYMDMTGTQIRAFVLSGNILPQPQYCPDVIYQIIQKCWSCAADDRMVPKDIVREIRLLKTNDGNIYSHYSSAVWPKVDEPLSSSDLNLDNLNSVSSTSAAADNDINKRRLQQTLLHANQKNSTMQRSSRTSLSFVQLPQQLSPSSDSLWGDTSVTPLIGRGSVDISSERGVSNQCDVNASIPFSNSLFNEPSSSSQTTLTNLSEFSPSDIRKRPLPSTPQDRENHVAELAFKSVKYDYQNKLGQGHYGEVFKGEYKDENGVTKSVAIKCLKKDTYKMFADEFDKEMRIMVKLDNPYIVKIIGQYPAGNDNHNRALVMEYVDKGCLRDFLKNQKSNKDRLLSGNQLIRFSCEIAEGMKYLSSQHIVHRDLAARNILVTEDEHMKISDFGLSRCLRQDQNYYISTGSKDFPAQWCAPEALSRKRFDEKGDVWSYGVTLWEIFTFGDPPKLCEDVQKDQYRLLQSGKRLAKPSDCPQQIYTIMLDNCWQYDIQKRDNFATILERIRTIESESRV